MLDVLDDVDIMWGMINKALIYELDYMFPILLCRLGNTDLCGLVECLPMWQGSEIFYLANSEEAVVKTKTYMLRLLGSEGNLVFWLKRQTNIFY